MMRSKLTRDEFIDAFISGEFHLVIQPSTGTQYSQYKMGMANFGIQLGHSKVIDFYQQNTIASMSYPGSDQMFSYFKCFTIEVWVFTLLSIILISLIQPGKVTMLKFFANIWTYFSALISAPVKKIESKILFYFWVISALFVGKYFTAFLLDFMVSSIPPVTIKTLEDLSLRSDLKIYVRGDSSLAHFAKTDDSFLAKALKTKIIPYFNYRSEGVPKKLALGLNNGSSAYIQDRLILIFTMIDIVRDENVSFDSIHISSDSATFEPFYIFLNLDMPKWAHTLLDQM